MQTADLKGISPAPAEERWGWRAVPQQRAGQAGRAWLLWLMEVTAVVIKVTSGTTLSMLGSMKQVSEPNYIVLEKKQTNKKKKPHWSSFQSKLWLSSDLGALMWIQVRTSRIPLCRVAQLTFTGCSAHQKPQVCVKCSHTCPAGPLQRNEVRLYLPVPISKSCMWSTEHTFPSQSFSTLSVSSVTFHANFVP